MTRNQSQMVVELGCCSEALAENKGLGWVADGVADGIGLADDRRMNLVPGPEDEGRWRIAPNNSTRLK